ncbi:hypothetical protein BGV60_33375 [Burkholderia ubonensis]|uniref:hypothetical protein n=1 Tax=Burkholderia ubonensis TaxID=101571 RepID=UPI00092278D8|nr:hypothetical protein [Burkholderia ubonensis]OJB41292.1 hypothetical protein BGV60_33375 [Burkholderia ubonensis]OJB44662.1 hypothetical protein BGV59_25800 [Burkholderia ubonensis]
MPGLAGQNPDYRGVKIVTGPSTCAAGACCRSRRTRSSANGTSRERELVLGVAYALLQFTPNVVDAGEAVVLLDVTASLRLLGWLQNSEKIVR